MKLTDICMTYQPVFNVSLIKDQLSSGVFASLLNLAGFMDTFQLSKILECTHEVEGTTDVKVIHY